MDTEGEIERLRKALEAETLQRVEAQTRLKCAHANCEEFVSTAAHNLRESLREVASYSQLLIEAYAGRFDPEADLFLRRIQDGAARMQSLLTDVVDYWETDSGDRQPSRTDMEAVLRQALLCTDQQIREAAAIITHDPLPAVSGDFELLARVLQHLIGNAIKFCGTPPAHVHVSARREDRQLVFSVEDNGPGIEPVFHDRVFGVFKRLHGREYPGNGLGLAFCKRAVEWHGGRIWIESRPGEGSRFYFILPPAD
jgi:light-regulated signal transduction histidine kinase (bacteriophytochrome)